MPLCCSYASDLDPGSWQPAITSRSGGYCQVNGLPVPRQEIRYLICGIVRQPGQHVGEPSLWIDIIELACRNQGIDGGCAVPSRIGARKCPVAAADSHTAYGSFGGIVGEADTAVIKET